MRKLIACTCPDVNDSFTFFMMRKILSVISLLSTLCLNQASHAEPEGFKVVTFAKPPQVTYPTGVGCRIGRRRPSASGGLGRADRA